MQDAVVPGSWVVHGTVLAFFGVYNKVAPRRNPPSHSTKKVSRRHRGIPNSQRIYPPSGVLSLLFGQAKERPTASNGEEREKQSVSRSIRCFCFQFRNEEPVTSSRTLSLHSHSHHHVVAWTVHSPIHSSTISSSTIITATTTTTLCSTLPIVSLAVPGEMPRITFHCRCLCHCRISKQLVLDRGNDRFTVGRTQCHLCRLVDGCNNDNHSGFCQKYQYHHPNRTLATTTATRDCSRDGSSNDADDGVLDSVSGRFPQ